MISGPSLHNRPHLSAEDKGLFFEESAIVRPPAERMARLYREGGNSALLATALEYDGASPDSPIMADTRQEQVAIYPYAAAIAKGLARSDKSTVFLGRDGEFLNDVSSVLHPDAESMLMPASQSLWKFMPRAPKDHVAAFLESHGLGFDSVETGDRRLFDTGFEGSIGLRVWETLSRLHGKSVEHFKDRLPIQLVFANHDSPYATTFMNFGFVAAPQVDAKLPRTSRSMNDEQKTNLGICLAVAMQLMPRYHGHYDRLEEVGGKIIAMPEVVEPSSVVRYSREGEIPNNASIIGVGKAAISQLWAIEIAHSQDVPDVQYFP